MLVLTRKLGEEINIGDFITVKVLDIRATQIKLGIEAPKGIAVHRGEVYERIQRQNLLASGVLAADFTAAEALFRDETGEEEQGRNE